VFLAVVDLQLPDYSTALSARSAFFRGTIKPNCSLCFEQQIDIIYFNPKRQAMKKEELLQFVKEKINSYAQRIIDANDKGDDSALGELIVYMGLRRILKGEERRIQDYGMMDAFNDVLKELGIIKSGKFYQDYFQ
jgi:hypothetical protein